MCLISLLDFSNWSATKQNIQNAQYTASCEHDMNFVGP